MIENLQTVSGQVLVLFILIGVGFVCAKIKLLHASSIKGMNEFVLSVVTPCAIIESFQREFDPKLLAGLGITFAVAVAIHLMNILLARLLIYDKTEYRQRVLRFAAIFSNAGFMALPLQKAILGDIGVFYGAVYVAVFNFFTWSYGLSMMSGDKKDISFLVVIRKPGTAGVLIGIALFLASISLPELVLKPVSYLGAMNTPLPMVIIGFYLANANFKAVLKLRPLYVSLAIRLLISPLIALLAMYLIGLKGDILVACTIGASAPVAAITTMFSSKYELDTSVSVGMVSLSTLLSIVTMPLIVSIAMAI